MNIKQLLVNAQEFSVVYKSLAAMDGISNVSSLEAGFAGLASSIGISTAALSAFLGVAAGIVVVVGLVKLVDALTVSFDEACEAANQSRSQFEETQNEIESLNSEIDTTQKRIDELQAKGSLTLVEQEELGRLQTSNALLERQLEIKKQIATLEGATAANDANVALTNADFEVYGDNSGAKRSWFRTLFGQNNTIGAADVNAQKEVVDVIEYTTRQQLRLNELQDEYDKMLAEGNEESARGKNIKKEIDAIQKEMGSNLKIIQDNEASLYDADGKVRKGYEDTARRIQELYSLITSDAEKAKDAQSQVDSFMNKPTYSAAFEQVEEYAQRINGITLEEFKSKFPDLYNAVAKYCDETGLEVENFVSTINAAVGTINVDEVKKQLTNAVPFDSKNIHELDAWADWIDGLSRKDLEIVYGIYQSQDTSAWSFDDWKIALENAKNETEDFSNTIDSVLSKPTLSKAVEGAKELATAMGGITADTIISQFPELASAAEAAGFDVQDVVDSINEAVNGIDFSKAKEELRDAFTFTPNGSAGDFKLMESWDSFIDSLSNEDIKILYGIYQSQDTSAWTLEDWRSALAQAKDEAANTSDTIIANAEKVASSISKVQSVLSSQAAGKSISLADFNSEELKDYTSALEYNNGTLQLNAEKVRQLAQAKADEETAILNSKKALDQSEYLKNASQIEQLRQKILDKNFAEGESVQSINAEIDALLARNGVLKNQCDQYNIMSQSLKEATDAYHNWLNAQSSSDYGDMFDDSMNAFQRIMDTYNSDSDIFGQFGSKKFEAAVEFWIPDSVDSDNIDSIKSYMDSVSNYLTFDDNGNAKGLNIEKFCDAAVSKGLMVLDDATDEYKIAGQMTMEQFAEGMNLSLPVVQAFFDQMQLYGGEFSWADEVNKTIGDLAVSATEAAESLRSKLHALGYEDYEINIDVSDIEGTENKVAALDKTIEEMQNLKGYVSVDSTEAQEANEIIAYCVRQKQLLADPVILRVDSSALSENLGEAIGKIQEFQTLANDIEVQKAIGLDTTTAETQLETLRGDIDGLDPNILATLGLDTSSTETLQATIEAMEPEVLVSLGVDEDAIMGIEIPDATITYDIDTTKPDEYQPDNKGATVEYNKDSEEPDSYDPENLERTVTYTKISWEVDTYNPQNLDRYVTYHITTEGKPPAVNGTAHAGGTANAGGDWGTAQGGMTLVGELGREIVVDPYTGQWYTVGDSGAEFTYIPKGAIVFNHQQTEDLLAHGYVTGRASALVGGTAMVTGGIKKQYAHYTNGGTYTGTSSNTSYSSYSSGSNSGVYAYDYSSDSASTSTSSGNDEDPWSATLKEYQHLRNMELMTDKEYYAALSKLMKDYYNQRTAYQDDYWSLEEEHFSLAKELSDDWFQDQEDHIDLLSKSPGTLQEQIETYKDMQDEAHRLADEARDMGLSEESDYIKALQKRWWDYYDAIQEKMIETFELQKSEHENVITLTQNWIDDAIHKGDMSKVKKYSHDIVAEYDAAQKAIHEEAEYYRSLGYSDESDEVSALSDLWWKYEDEKVAAIVAGHEAVVSEYTNTNILIENWMNQAIANGDRKSVEKYTKDTITNYKAMQDEIHEEAEYYRSLGYSDTSKEVSALSDLWWDYEAAIVEATTAGYQALVDNAHDALDTIQGVFDTMKKAAKEYNENGYITVDTFQEIAKLGVQYLSYLKDENGELVINEANIQKVIAAKTQQVAVETALNYVQSLRQAITDGDTEALNRLIFATEMATNDTWDLVYAQLRLLGLTDAQYNQALWNINALRSITDSAVSGIGQVDGAAKQALEDTKSGLDDLLKYVKAMIKQEIENQIEALEDQVDKYKEIVDLQKKSLKLEKEKDSYTKDVTKKTKEIAELQQRIAMLDLDDSREAQAEKIKLQEELAEVQEDLADKQSDHAYDVTVDMLDDTYDAYKKEKDEEINVLKDSISSEEKLYQLAIKRINEHWDTLYADLIAWNTQYGTDTNETLTAAWNAASQAVLQYGSYLEAVEATQQRINALSEGSYSSIGLNNSSEYDTSGAGASTVASMYNNSVAWWGAGTDERKNLEAENERLAKQFENETHVGLEKKNGSWYIEGTNQELYAAYGYGSVAHTSTQDQSHYNADAESVKALINLAKNYSSGWRADMTQEQKNDLHNKVAAYVAQMAKYGVYASYDEKTGEWKITKDTLNSSNVGKSIYRATYHGGTSSVGGFATLKQDEEFAILQKGEMVLNKNQQSTMFEVLDMAQTLISRFGKLFNSAFDSNLFQTRMQDQFKEQNQQLQSAMVDNSNSIGEINVPVQIYSEQKLDDDALQRLAKRTSDVVISEINNSFYKRGKGSLRSPMKP